MAEVRRPAPISLASSLTCAEHGHALACLASTGCDQLTFAPPASWPLLEAAAGEKLAWAMGVRIALLPSSLVLGPAPYDVRLRPTSATASKEDGALILTAKPRAPAHCAPRPPAPPSGAGAEPLVLRPLSLPALLVAPHTTDNPQDERLSAAFDAALGPGWKAGRTEARVAAQANDMPQPDWSVYFVPLGSGFDERSLPAAVAAKWRGAQGVLTVWPTHLARPLAPTPRRPAALPPRFGGGLGAAPDLMSAATGLFDFFTSYTEPEPEVEEEEEAEETEEPIMIEEEDDSSSKREDESVGDLFSAHSQSPEPEIEEGDLFGSTFTTPRASALELDGVPEPNDDADLVPVAVDSMDVDGLFGDDGDDGTANVTADTVVPPAIITEVPSRASELDDSRNNLVTEDDFNFFDSPPPDEIEVATPETPKGERIFEPTGAEPKFEVISRAPSRPVSRPLSRMPSRAASRAASRAPSRATSPRLSSLALSLRLKESVQAPPRPPSPPPVEAVEVIEPAAKKPRYLDSVPPAFAPLPLGRRRRPRFAYGLPSPASTVSSLRADLVDRIRASCEGGGTSSEKDKTPKYDYTASWDVDSDESDSEADSQVTTNGPPTPTSTADYEDGTPAPMTAIFPPPPPPADDEVEFEGTICVGGEWSSLKDAPTMATSIGRPWAQSWVEEVNEVTDAYPSPAPEPKVDLDLGSVDIDALANAVVRNRFFRRVFDNAATEQSPVRPPTQLLKTGAMLLELTETSSEKQYTLPTATVNVGYGGHIMRLSVAALRYWRELGLSPAGGPKDVEAYAVCEPGDDSERLASDFLRDIGEVYTVHNLGKHETAKDAIVTASPSGTAAAVGKLRAKATKPMVIYVITYSTSVTPTALAPLLAASYTSSFVHVVPAGAIRLPNLMSIAFEIYDMIPRPLKRVNLHGKPLDLPEAWMPFHAFTIAGEEDPKPSLSMAWPQRNYDVLNRWRLVHGSWAYIKHLGVLVLAMADAQGDSCEVKAIRMEGTPATRAQKVWDVFAAFASAAATEWRLTVCSYGLMAKEDLDGGFYRNCDRKC